MFINFGSLASLKEVDQLASKGRRSDVPRYKMIAVEPGVYEEVRDLMHERKLRSLGQAVAAAVSEVRASA